MILYKIIHICQIYIKLYIYIKTTHGGRIEAQYNPLELDENGSINEKTPAFAEVYSRWGG